MSFDVNLISWTWPCYHTWTTSNHIPVTGSIIIIIRPFRLQTAKARLPGHHRMPQARIPPWKRIRTQSDTSSQLGQSFCLDSRLEPGGCIGCQCWGGWSCPGPGCWRCPGWCPGRGGACPTGCPTDAGADTSLLGLLHGSLFLSSDQGGAFWFEAIQTYSTSTFTLVTLTSHPSKTYSIQQTYLHTILARLTPHLKLKLPSKQSRILLSFLSFLSFFSFLPMMTAGNNATTATTWAKMKSLVAHPLIHVVFCDPFIWYRVPFFCFICFYLKLFVFILSYFILFYLILSYFFYYDHYLFLFVFICFHLKLFSNLPIRSPLNGPPIPT